MNNHFVDMLPLNFNNNNVASQGGNKVSTKEYTRQKLKLYSYKCTTTVKTIQINRQMSYANYKY